MNAWVIVAIVVGFEAVFIPLLVFGLVQGSWVPLQDKFPAEQREADAVRKQFQSIRIDMFNLGFCAHLAVDSQHMHIEPAWLLRKARAKTISVPWQAMAGYKQRGRYAKVKLGGTTLTAPAWAMELAKPTD